MTYEQARYFIEDSNKYGSKLGLSAITELLRRLGNPQDRLKLIHVAGTNGKGSTTAFIASILSAEGYCVGRYISPAVFSYRERIQIGNEYITEQGIIDSIEALKPICEAMVEAGYDHPTSFEIETAMAFLYLADAQVDYGVIEVGLGGRLDATNVIRQPLCCVITSISMDHMQYLGDTIEQIAYEKAGIIKKGAAVITSNTSPEVISVLRDACVSAETKLLEAAKVSDIRTTLTGTKFLLEGQEYEIHLLGEYQTANAALAVQTMKALQSMGHRISDDSITKGLQQAKWNGRLELIAKEPYFMIDGAHNEDAATELRKVLEQLFSDRRKIFILGVLADKEYRKILKITAPLADVIITITPDNSRALASAVLAKEAAQFTKAEIIDACKVSRAVSCAYEIAGKEDIILAFGSLSYLGEIKECLSE